jgi:hypothetical protein
MEMDGRGAVDASACATTFGRFEINFLREKEDAPELEFSERFTWKTGELRTGQIEVSIDFWIDEAVYEYSVGYVTPCGCRNEQSGVLPGLRRTGE